MKKILFTLTALFVFIFSFGQFGPQQEITESAAGNQDICSADINNDGYIDIISASMYDNKIAWYENQGDGTFSRQKIITTDAEGATGVFVADIDNDGIIDVLSSSTLDDKIAWYKNDGNGNFYNHYIVSTTSEGPRDISACDLDNDGDMDILSALYWEDQTVWFENDGNGNFSEQQTVNICLSAETVYTADLNGDNNMDVISAFNNSIVWSRNIGSAVFDTTQTISSTFYTNLIAPLDFDEDGDLDIIYSQSNLNKINCFLNDGVGNFTSETILNTAYNERILSVIDVNNDEQLDVITTAIDEDLIVVYLNDGTGSYVNNQAIESPSIHNGGSEVTSVHPVDIDEDGDLDIFPACKHGVDIVSYKNDGSGNFIYGSLLAESDMYSGHHINTIDLDVDGFLDIIAGSTQCINWYKGDGNGNFVKQTISDYNYSGLISVCNIDNDDDYDIVVSYLYSDKIVWFENDGNNNFNTENIISSTLDRPRAKHPVDVDNDGDLDIIAIITTDDQIVWFENDGNGNFGPELEIKPPSSPYVFCTIMDVDNDGNIDVISYKHLTSSPQWYRNDGMGNFQLETFNHPTASLRRIYAGDINGDSYEDIILYTGNDELSYLENDGMGNFETASVINNNIGNIDDVHVEDVDLDGDSDLLTVSRDSNKVSWYENTNGQGSFGPEHVITTKVSEPKDVHTCDIDGDGDYDVLTTTRYDYRLAWYENYLYGAPCKLVGSVFLDQNQNGQKEPNEECFHNALLHLNPDATGSFTNYAGDFWFAVDTGNYILTYTPSENWTLTTDSSEYHIHLTTEEPIADSLDFGFYPSNFITDINPELTASSSICSSEANFWINYQNLGTTNPDGVVELILDDSITFVSSAIVPDSVIGQSIYWHFDSLNFFASGQIPLTVQVPDFNSMGDTLTSVLNIYTTDSTGQFFFTDTLSEELACSYDPNDKLVTPRGIGEEGTISKDETLEYTVRFQNTGNTEAINIKIRDQIDLNLDITSIEILAASHDVQAYIQQNRWLVFQFDSIMLPDSTSNEIESHGFVKFNIRINEEVLPNTQIFNTAHIYFDYNPAVITNTVMNTIECYIAPETPFITQNGSLLEVSSVDELQWFFNGTVINGATENTLEFTENGNYTVIAMDENDCFTESEVYTVTNVGIEAQHAFKLSVYPNPTKGFVVIESDIENAGTCFIYGIDGQLIKQIELKKEGKLQKNIISTKDWAKGIYLIKVGELTKKLVVE
jgi:uncharacterized repeat protein (TIGR01451 family)